MPVNIDNNIKNNFNREGHQPLRLNSIEAIRTWLKTNHLPEALNTSISQTLNNLIAVEKFDYIQLQESGEAEPVGLILDVYRMMNSLKPKLGGLMIS